MKRDDLELVGHWAKRKSYDVPWDARHVQERQRDEDLVGLILPATDRHAFHQLLL